MKKIILMNKVSDIFDIEYPKTLILNQQSFDSSGINFVSSTGSNNGVATVVAERFGIKKYKAGAITVSLKGSVLSAFLQPRDFYIAHQNAVLYPKTPMSEIEKLYYCLCISRNKFRYNYGRQADRTLPNLIIPSISALPQWIKSITINDFANVSEPLLKLKDSELITSVWEYFSLNSIFEIKKGKRLTKLNMKKGETPFVAAIDSNNGYRQYITENPIHTGNTIAVNYNGSVAEAFYQPKPYWATDDVNVLYPKFNMNKYVALFICTVIRREKYRYNYGRKWHMERMNVSKIRLPAKDGMLDTNYMENYIKSLPFSSQI